VSGQNRELRECQPFWQEENAYRIKNKLFRALMGFEITEV
jgi:hypothetical protein